MGEKRPHSPSLRPLSSDPCPAVFQREKLCDQYDFLRSAPKGSHIWWFANRPEDMIVKHAQSEEWTQLYCSSALFKPRSAAGARIVSTHGDCHRLNLIRTDDGIKFVDLE